MMASIKPSLRCLLATRLRTARSHRLPPEVRLQNFKATTVFGVRTPIWEPRVKADCPTIHYRQICNQLTFKIRGLIKIFEKPRWNASRPRVRISNTITAVSVANYKTGNRQRIRLNYQRAVTFSLTLQTLERDSK